MQCILCTTQFEKLLKCNECSLECCENCVKDWYIKNYDKSCPQCRRKNTFDVGELHFPTPPPSPNYTPNLDFIFVTGPWENVTINLAPPPTETLQIQVESIPRSRSRSRSRACCTLTCVIS